MTTLSRRHLNLGLGAAALAGLAPASARAQAFPSGDLHFVCAFPPGSGADVLVRYFAEKIKPYIGGRSVIVENKPGALSNVATEYTARSKPDGHTVYIHGASALAANMHLFKNPSVDAGKAIQIAATINKQPTLIAVVATSPHKSVKELTAAMKQKGDKASYASSNPVAKVMGELYKQKAGLDAVEVTYRTSQDALNDLSSGAIDYIMIDNVAGMAQQRAGRLRVLGISSKERLGATGDIPTMAEQGIDMDITGWWAAMVPSATPKPVVEQLNKWFSEIVASEDAKKFLNSFASDPWVTTPDEAQAFFLQQIEAWGEYVRVAKIEKMG